MTGLGTPVANLLVPDLVAYQGPGTTYAGPTVGPLQDATLVNTGASASGPIDVFSVFDAFTVRIGDGGDARRAGPGDELDSALGNTPGPGQSSRRAAERDLDIPSAATALNWGGMMPLDSMAARDAVLTDWSSSLDAAVNPSHGRAATLRGPVVHLRILDRRGAGEQGRARRPVGGPAVQRPASRGLAPERPRDISPSQEQ